MRGGNPAFLFGGCGKLSDFKGKNEKSLTGLDRICRRHIIKKSMENLIQKKHREKRNQEIRKLYPELTLAEISLRYNLSRERIRQIIKGRKNIIIK